MSRGRVWENSHSSSREKKKSTLKKTLYAFIWSFGERDQLHRRQPAPPPPRIMQLWNVWGDVQTLVIPLYATHDPVSRDKPQPPFFTWGGGVCFTHRDTFAVRRLPSEQQQSLHPALPRRRVCIFFSKREKQKVRCRIYVLRHYWLFLVTLAGRRGGHLSSWAISRRRRKRFLVFGDSVEFMIYFTPLVFWGGGVWTHSCSRQSLGKKNWSAAL